VLVGFAVPQNLNSLYGKIITIDLDTKKIDILSIGHRNPQGLFYDVKNDILFSTEHGPQGGDEINVNVSPKLNKIKNFGWAISSYGEHYGFDDGWSEKIKKETDLIDDLYKVAPLNKSHKDFGFEEPIKYFTPSIGITEILKVKNNKSDIHKLLVSSLGWNKEADIMTLHIIDFDNNFFEKNHEKIFVDDRIRDFIDLKNGSIIMTLDKSGSIALLSNVY
jgi:glucose/arabinose dehydrogenase